ncbi:sodium:proton antiporter [Algisphaera agarilytica]|uniref:Multicomponent Na+:H+ antiporter subunit C n=1 Tax=Algisphaera agarilytica TaxID=1385975 RepID=A0A7X0H3B0_9BACT|nr:sodium:proton antiporter [Algisphaera agarilytica]MBB6428435.1 multicomponent Na+:H+ antiporter subunit C [Algisphaera agarilytica]
MTFVLAACVAVCFGVSVYLLLGRDLKGVAMGVFLIGHAANMSILAMSGSPVPTEQEITSGVAIAELKEAPLSAYDTPSPALGGMVDPLPQALILTAIVIGFAVMGFLLTLLVITARSAGTLELGELAKDDDAEEPTADATAAPGGAA